MATIYASSTATGANNGTSWTDAYTSLSSVASAHQAGDTIYLNAPESTPFVGTLSAVPSNCRVIGDEGPAGETWITSTATGTWTDAGGGVFSMALASAPVYVVYDFKRDDIHGTVTGWAPADCEEGRALTAKGYDLAKCVAWYGFLANGGATSSPSEGQYGYTGGVLYINPPGSPVTATVNALARYVPNGTAISGIATAGGSAGQTIKGITAWLYPATTGNQGYAIRLQGGNATAMDCVGIACGWHTHGAAGSGQSIGGNKIIRCMSLNDTEGSPYVFYTNVIDLPQSGNELIDCCTIHYGNLLTTGAPITTPSEVTPFLQHTGGVHVIGGTKVDRLIGIDARQYIFTKQASGTITTSKRVLQADNPPPITDTTKHADYPIHARDCYFGGPFIVGHSVAYERCVIDGETITTTRDSYTPTSLPILFSEGAIFHGKRATGGGSPVIHVGTARIQISDSYISVDATNENGSSIFTLNSTTGVFTLTNNRFVATGGANLLVFAWTANYNAAPAQFSGCEDNVMSTSITRLMQHQNSGVAARNMSWWQSNISATDANGSVAEPDRHWIHSHHEQPSLAEWNNLLRSRNLSSEAYIESAYNKLRRYQLNQQ